MNLKVFIEKDSEKIYCGNILDAKFSYSDNYLENDNSKAISVSLPLQKEKFTAEKTKAFFDGLLPEGFSRKILSDRIHTSENDYLNILSKLGTECLGAIQIIENDDAEKPSYEKLSLDKVKALAAEGASKSTQIILESHLSLAGASGKVGLYYDEQNDTWYQPLGTAPSTHIVKQSHVRLRGIVINELLCQWTANECGIDTPKSFIIHLGDNKDDSILFATKRYDRTFNNKKIINGLPCPARLHQEDFAQALGIQSENKYETKIDSYLKQCFQLIQEYSGNPLADSIKLWNIIMFNYLIGNTDSHLKNFSLLYDEKLETPLLAPAYDLISTAIYEGSTRKLAMRIGNAEYLDQLGIDDIKLAAREVKLNERIAIACYKRMMDKLPNALDSCAEKIAELGFEQVIDIKDKIKKHGGIK